MVFIGQSKPGKGSCSPLNPQQTREGGCFKFYMKPYWLQPILTYGFTYYECYSINDEY